MPFLSGVGGLRFNINAIVLGFGLNVECLIVFLVDSLLSNSV